MEISSGGFLTALLLTLFAGGATAIGSLIAFLAKRTNRAFMSISLGLSAGVMIYISFVELFAESKEILMESYGGKAGYGVAILSFFAGMLIMALIDRLVPSVENPHEVRSVEQMNDENHGRRKLMRVGILSALAIGIHNFPEGMVTFMAGLEDVSIALPIAVAIALHNIPEGIAVSVPVYQATGSRKKALYLSMASGLAEPIGGVIGYLLLAPFMSSTVMGILYAAIAGIMIFISLDELLPTAREYGKHHLAIYGLVAGMAIMALSLYIFE